METHHGKTQTECDNKAGYRNNGKEGIKQQTEMDKVKRCAAGTGQQADCIVWHVPHSSMAATQTGVSLNSFLP